MGPLKQLKRMFEPTRLIATIVMLVNIILCIYSYLYSILYFGFFAELNVSQDIYSC